MTDEQAAKIRRKLVFLDKIKKSKKIGEALTLLRRTSEEQAKNAGISPDGKINSLEYLSLTPSINFAARNFELS